MTGEFSPQDWPKRRERSLHLPRHENLPGIKARVIGWSKADRLTPGSDAPFPEMLKARILEK
ncbi:MAG: hypothetical protein HRT77_01445 [Halioglobus sp.]|nr:hypothetical protein [Halioglobus sp.]